MRKKIPSSDVESVKNEASIMTAPRVGRQKAAAKKHTRARRSADRRWSARVTRESNALDLDRGVFTWSDPRRIAASLKRSAERSHRRKAEPFRSAMSMLAFFINRGGKNLPARQKRVLEKAKDELRRQFHRA